MSIAFRCPSGHLLSIPDEYAGRKLRCPKCLKIADIPAVSIELKRPSARRESRSPGVKPPGAKDRASSPGKPLPPPLKTGRAAEPFGQQPRREVEKQRREESRAQSAEPAASTPEPFGLDESADPPPRIQGYRADRYKTQTVYLLAAGLAMLCLFHMAPALSHRNWGEAPNWARLVMLLSILELTYVAWMALVPDWSTVWVAMLVFAVVAALYGTALAIVVVTPPDRPLRLGMDGVRQSARLWCGSVILLTTLMTYLCGRISYQWRRSYW